MRGLLQPHGQPAEDAACQILTRNTAVIEVNARVVRLLVAELRVLSEHIGEFEDAIALAFPEHPEKNLFTELPGAGPSLAPRLLAAFGTSRSLFPDATSMQRYFGVAPVTEKSGTRAWIHWRWNAPSFLRQTLVEWAGLTVMFCPWAKAYYEQQRAKRTGHQAILRALAFKWLRILWRCWQNREAYNQARYLCQLENVIHPSLPAHANWPSKWRLKESQKYVARLRSDVSSPMAALPGSPVA